jgi:microcin C transport system substrate-binding protein
MNRRTLLGSTLLAIATRPLIWPRWISAARAGDRNWRHGVSFFDDLKYPAGFGHFEYVNPDSPKGGTAHEIALGTFDNFNSVVAGVKGSERVVDVCAIAGAAVIYVDTTTNHYQDAS